MSEHSLFDEPRAAQAAAFLLVRAGGELSSVKLMDLLYLAERESYRMYGEPLCGGELVSTRLGPNIAQVVDLLCDGSSNAADGWSAWVVVRGARCVALRDPGDAPAALAHGDVEILRDVWSRDGHAPALALTPGSGAARCPEWNSRAAVGEPIGLKRLFECLGYSGEGVRSAVAHLQEQWEVAATDHCGASGVFDVRR